MHTQVVVHSSSQMEGWLSSIRSSSGVTSWNQKRNQTLVSPTRRHVAGNEPVIFLICFSFSTCPPARLPVRLLLSLSLTLLLAVIQTDRWLIRLALSVFNYLFVSHCHLTQLSLCICLFDVFLYLAVVFIVRFQSVFSFFFCILFFVSVAQVRQQAQRSKKSFSVPLYFARRGHSNR